MIRTFILSLGVTLTAFAPREARACGGGEYTYAVGGALGPAAAVNTTFQEDAWDGRYLTQYRFLGPFVEADRPYAALMAELAYKHQIPNLAAAAEAMPLPAEDLRTWQTALERGDLAAARAEAERLVQDILSMPAPVALRSSAALAQASEFLELQPAVKGLAPDAVARFFLGRSAPAELPPVLQQADALRGMSREQRIQAAPAYAHHPRGPALELAGLEQRARAAIRDGWPALTVDAGTWVELEGAYDAWLAKNRAHPLADLARLQKLRVLYLHRSGDACWALLLDLYTRHPARAVWEMRHLLVAWMPPPRLETVKDPVLLTALAAEEKTFAPGEWEALWARSKEGKGAPWAVNLQERLMERAIRADQPLTVPSEKPAAPTARWAQLRTALLLSLGRVGEACSQAELLDRTQLIGARLYAQAFGRANDWPKALDAQALLPTDVEYFLDMVVDEAALRNLVTLKHPHAAAAALALAARRLDAEGWEAGAKTLEPVDTQKAAQWREAARLATDESAKGRLKLARWLKGAGPQLFRPTERYVSRDRKLRFTLLREALVTEFSSGEAERLSRFLLRYGGREQALWAYAQALERLPPKSAEARAALAEADAVYNKVLHWDTAYRPAFEALLAASPPAVTIRECGKEIRGAKKP